MTGPSRVSAWILRSLTSPARADAVIGDVREDLARRVEAGEAPRWPGLWLEHQTWRFVMAALESGLPRAGRAVRFVLRDAWRALWSAPASTGFILLVLTVGIAAATVTFSVVDTVVLRDLPFEDDDELVVVSEAPGRPGDARIVAPQEFLAWRDGVEGMSALAAVRVWRDRVQTSAGLHAVESARVTASLFDVLRVRPALGQLFSAANEVAGNDGVIVISHGLWQRHFAADPAMVGKTVSLVTPAEAGTRPTRPFVVLGVMPEGFTYPIGRGEPVDLWRPYVFSEEDRRLTGGISSFLHVVGRLQPGLTLEQAEAQVTSAVRPVADAFPFAYREWRAEVIPLYDSLVGEVRGWMLIVLWAVALVLVVACVNIANMLLTRSARRARELAIRASLGAGRRTLVAVLIVESLMLALAAAGLGLLLAVWGVGVARAALPEGIARAAGIALDLRVLLVAVGAAVLTGLFFGAVPAGQASRVDLAVLLKEGATTVAGGRQRWRTAFLVAQVAFVGVLLVATTLFVSSFVRIVYADLGFDRSHLISVTQSRDSTVSPEDVAASLGALPGVESVALLRNGDLPLINSAFASISVRLPDSPADAPPVNAEYRAVSPGYFATAGIPILHGRDFGDPADASIAPIVLDELLARELFGDRNPVGETVRTRTLETVIGVVAHVRLRGPEGPSEPQAYVTTTTMGGARVLVRTSIDPDVVAPAIRERLASMGGGATAPDVVLLEDAFGRLTADRRFSATLMSIFGALALFIGAAGVYGVMSSMVAQRTKEIGVRVALGATAGRVTREVLGQTGRYLLLGLVIGLPIAMATSRMFAALLYEVQPTDAFVYVIVSLILLIVGLAAALIPARRAARVDPLVALRAE